MFRQIPSIQKIKEHTLKKDLQRFINGIKRSANDGCSFYQSSFDQNSTNAEILAEIFKEKGYTTKVSVVKLPIFMHRKLASPRQEVDTTVLNVSWK